MRTIDLTPNEWRLLACLPLEFGDAQVPVENRNKLIRLGMASEKRGHLVATFEGRLMLRDHNQREHS